MVDTVKLVKVERFAILYKASSLGKYFFTLREGEIEMSFQDGNSATLRKLDSFGEHALFQDCRRNATAMALEDSILYCIDGRQFRKINANLNLIERSEKLLYMMNVPFFSLTLSSQSRNFSHEQHFG